MLEELVPTQVVCVETTQDHPIALFPQEQAVVAGAVEKRRLEFGTARWCARAALRGLGLPPTPIVPQQRGEPSWPPAVVGSITHCLGYRAAAVAFRRDVLTVGIDAEPNEPLPGGVFEAISLPEERQEHRRLGAVGDVCWDRLLFSMKESVYKAWYPVAHRFLDFNAATVHIDPERGAFTAKLHTQPARVAGLRVAGFTGRWVARDGLLVTAIAVLSPDPAPREGADATGSRSTAGQ
jgi:4'-phosphopantetheinyl transferase EntD